MSGEYIKPLPEINELNYRYWEATKRHELVLQKCMECGHYRYPPGDTCPSCLSDRLEWVETRGRGTVYSWVVFHQIYHPAFAEDIPYTVVAVELEEGPRLVTNLLDCKPEDIEVGMPVEVVFDDVTDDITLPKFRPLTGRSR